METGPPLLRQVVAAGRIEVRDDRGIKLLVSEIKPWEEASASFRSTLHIEVRAEDLSPPWLAAVDHVLSAHPGESEVTLGIVMPDRSRRVSRSKRYKVADGSAVANDLAQQFPMIRVTWVKGGA